MVFHQGLFTSRDAACAGRSVSFVHLDVDLEAGTRACPERVIELPGSQVVMPIKA